MQSPEFYANLQTGFVGRFEDKVGRFDRFLCALCFELENTFLTQNKVHHLLAILNFIFDFNITQVIYVIQCFIASEVKFNKVQF